MLYHPSVNKRCDRIQCPRILRFAGTKLEYGSWKLWHSYFVCGNILGSYSEFRHGQSNGCDRKHCGCETQLIHCFLFAITAPMRFGVTVSTHQTIEVTEMWAGFCFPSEGEWPVKCWTSLFSHAQSFLVKDTNLCDSYSLTKGMSKLPDLWLLVKVMVF